MYNFCQLIVADCDYADSYGWFLSVGNDNASHEAYLVPDDS